MKYRKLNTDNTFTLFEDKDVDLYVINLFDTDSGCQVYKNDIIRIDGEFNHTIWYNATKRSSGKPSTTRLSGYAIYKVLEGGEFKYDKLKLLKSEHSYFNQKNNVYFAKIVEPSLYDWNDKKSIRIIGNIYFSNIEKLLSENTI